MPPSSAGPTLLAPLGLALLLVTGSVGGALGGTVLAPVIEGPWWQVAGDPDLGPLTDPKQQPVDFAIWQAADGSWQLWSCIRHTRCGGKTRLFYRWEGRRLTEPNWRPMGVAMQAEEKYGETPGGLQAPFVFRDNDKFVMFYGDWEHICSAESRDGKSFARRLDAAGRSGLFSEGAGANTRDPMVLRIGGLWHCYYTAHPQNRGAVYARTSADLRTWSASRVVARGGRAGSGPWSAECPFVLELPPGHFYLFRTQRYGQQAQTSVYHSADPLNFGVDEDVAQFVCTLPVAAPEILTDQGQTFIAALLPSLKGIQIARLAWKPAEMPSGTSR